MESFYRVGNDDGVGYSTNLNNYVQDKGRVDNGDHGDEEED